ncbi:aldehyde dehydrogenase (NADP(+)) [Paraburkholderia fungorum]|uniref:Aldehyde dehydrogenase n=1 Tax=Paraburkholderia fungorum TaxID=134537 RepID=A0A420FUS4_9BURK|nr:aldehyde dehydrogenase (NADP(+)) [Paraburkholderia fungorum]RKF36706.1 aldehyde dehydrogenase [Paraburkholderia fungorum]
MLQSFDARNGRPVGKPWSPSSPAAIDAAVAAAAEAADFFGSLPAAKRAVLLRALADALEGEHGTLVLLADGESALGVTRLKGELVRTCFQLRGFAEFLEAGAADVVVDDPAVAGPPPAGRPHLRRVRVPLGPVAVFAASNFPFAFSVLGGDTASALAAGCPVIVKAHPAHPALSQMTAKLAQQVVANCGLPPGVFQFIEGAGFDTGVRLMGAPAIAAAAFTGSFAGGTALAKIAAERKKPIPFYGELGSVNPVVVLPGAFQQEDAAQALAASIGLGAGQFCTSPGVIVVEQSAAGDAFVNALATAAKALRPHAMLSAGIRAAFERGVAVWRGHDRLEVLTGETPSSVPEPCTFLAQVSAADFICDDRLHGEVFGCAALVVRVSLPAETLEVLRAIGGSLTVTLWGVPPGEQLPGADVQELVRTAMKVAGRVLFSGVPTGVAVTTAQQHGGPFPASTAPMTTSVGYSAMERFLRPVALQDAPAWLTRDARAEREATREFCS